TGSNMARRWALTSGRGLSRGGRSKRDSLWRPRRACENARFSEFVADMTEGRDETTLRSYLCLRPRRYGSGTHTGVVFSVAVVDEEYGRNRIGLEGRASSIQRSDNAAIQSGVDLRVIQLYQAADSGDFAFAGRRKSANSAADEFVIAGERVEEQHVAARVVLQTDVEDRDLETATHRLIRRVGRGDRDGRRAQREARPGRLRRDDAHGARTINDGRRRIIDHYAHVAGIRRHDCHVGRAGDGLQLLRDAGPRTHRGRSVRMVAGDGQSRRFGPRAGRRKPSLEREASAAGDGHRDPARRRRDRELRI